MKGCVLIVWLTVIFHIPIHSCWYTSRNWVGLAYLAPVPGIDIVHRQAVLLTPKLQRIDAKTADAVFTLAHELGHHRAGTPNALASEQRASRWARRNWSYVVRKLAGDLATARMLWRLLNPDRIK